MPRSFSQPPEWICKPGGWDTTGTREIFPSSSELGIPDLLPQSFSELPSSLRLKPYRTKQSSTLRDICHFYLDDYRFETTWNRPNAAVNHLRRYWAALAPDFSLYPQWPAVVNQWNTYRSRWLGRWWQSQGLRVIPTVNWADTASHAYCFDGIPPGQIVSIGVPDARRPHVVERYHAGVIAMCEKLRPKLVIAYGESPVEIPAPVVEFKPDWYQLRNLEPQGKSSEAAQKGDGLGTQPDHGIVVGGSDNKHHHAISQLPFREELHPGK